MKHPSCHPKAVGLCLARSPIDEEPPFEWTLLLLIGPPPVDRHPERRASATRWA